MKKLTLKAIILIFVSFIVVCESLGGLTLALHKKIKGLLWR